MRHTIKSNQSVRKNVYHKKDDLIVITFDTEPPLSKRFIKGLKEKSKRPTGRVFTSCHTHRKQMSFFFQTMPANLMKTEQPLSPDRLMMLI